MAGGRVVTGVLGVLASVVQYRRDAQRDVLQVKVTNEGPAPVHVTHVRLDTTTFTAPVEVAVPVPERAPLQDLIDRACGFQAPTS